MLPLQEIEEQMAGILGVVFVSMHKHDVPLQSRGPILDDIGQHLYERVNMKAVSEGAIVKRINRKLAHEGEHLCKVRGGGWTYSPYYIANDRNMLICEDVHLGTMGKELGVLFDHEYVEGWDEAQAG